MQNVFESFSAIERSINAALRIWPVGMPRNRHENALRIFWIDSQLRNLLAIVQSQMRPRFAGINRFINAVTDRKIRPMHSFVAADIHNVRI